jgi:hypothetical protein
VSIGAVLGESWELYLRFFARFVLIAAIVFAVVNGIYALVVVAAGTDDGAATVVWVIGLAASIIGTYWLQAALVYAVQDARDGSLDTGTADIFRRSTPFLVPLVVAGILAGVAIGIGFVLLIVPGLFLLTIWAVIAPAIVVEETGVAGAFSRSRALVRGHFWVVFAIVVITTLLTGIASGVLQVLFSFLPRALEIFVGGTIASAVVAPFMAIAFTLLFFKLRDAHNEAAGAGFAG